MLETTEHLRYATPGEMQRVREAVARRNIPHKVLAEALGLDVSAISKVLAGARKLKRAELLTVQQVMLTNLNTGDRLRQVAGIARVDPHAFGTAAGIAPDRFEDLLNDSSAITEAEAHQLAEALGLPRGFFLWESVHPNMRETIREGMREKGAFVPGETNPFRSQASLRSKAAPAEVQIFAPLRALGDGMFTDDFVEAERRRVPMIENIAGAYGLWIEGNHLAPRYEHGEIIYVHPARPVGVGQWTLIQDGKGRVVIGKVEVHAEDHVQVRIPQRKEPREISLGHATKIATILGGWIY